MITARHQRRLLVLLGAVNLANFFDRQLLPALAEPIKHAFGLSDAQVGGLNSAFEFTYPLAAVGMALLSDRWVRRRIIAIGVTIWSLATVLTGLAGSYLVLALARAGLGVGCGGYGPSGLAIISDAFPSSQRSRAVAIHDSGLMIGSALGFLLGGLMGEALGWRMPFLIAGLPGLLLALLVWRIREPDRGASEYDELGVQPPPESSKPGLSLARIGELLATRTLRAVYAANVLISFATGGLAFWLPTFLVRMHGFSLGQAGLLSGVMQVAAGLAGVMLGGWLADRWVKRNPGGRLLTLAAGYLVGTPLAVLAIVTPSTTLFGVTTVLAVICYTVYFPCLGPQIHDVSQPSMRATALAVNIFLGHFLGNMLSTPVIGWLSDITGDLRLALLSVPVFALLGGLVALGGARLVEGDRRRMLSDLTQSTSQELP